MRIIILLVSAIFMMCGTSCSTIEDELQLEALSENNKESVLNLSRAEQLNKVFVSLDSLNLVHQGHVSRNWRGFNIRLSDLVGSMVCSQYGGGIGAALGFWAGGPVGSTIGGFYGMVSGSQLGYAFTSYYVHKKYDCAGYAVQPPFNYFNCSIKMGRFYQLYVDGGSHSITLTTPENNILGNELVDPADPEPVFSIDPIILKCDSLGYYHNNMMVKLEDRKYADYGIIDTERMLDDMIIEMQNQGFDTSQILTTESERNGLIMMVTEIGDLAMDLIGASLDEILDVQCMYMKRYNVTEEDLEIHKNFIGQIALKCSELSVMEIDSYAEDINAMLMTLDIPNDMRFALALHAERTINSCLCWIDQE